MGVVKHKRIASEAVFINVYLVSVLGIFHVLLAGFGIPCGFVALKLYRSDTQQRLLQAIAVDDRIGRMHNSFDWS
jgi:hypothetical protein